MTILLERVKGTTAAGEFPNFAGGATHKLVNMHSEDVLTANVFGSLAYLPRVAWLDQLLSANGLDGLVNYDPVSIECWKKHRPPHDYVKLLRERVQTTPNMMSPDMVKRKQSRKQSQRASMATIISEANEGDTEVDVVVRCRKKWMIFIEAKYRSDLTSRTSYDPERDQGLRNVDVGLEATKLTGEDFYFSLLTPRPEDGSFAEARASFARLTDANKLSRMLPHRATDPRLAEQASRIVWLHWEGIGDALRLATPFLSECERRIADDLAAYIDFKMTTVFADTSKAAGFGK